MKIALIGCGRIAKNHIKATLENDFEILALCDILPEQIDKLMQAFPSLKASAPGLYTDYHELLKNETPDFISIATESGCHAQIALDCIDAGFPVIVEKPIALSLEDADEIIRRSEEKNVVVSVCHQNRFNIAVQHMRSALERGAFGLISHGSVHVRWNRNEDYYKQAAWRGTWTNDGGCLMNQSIHGIDLLRWMMGDDIDEVCAYTSKRFHPYLECEDVGLAIVKFSNGAIGTIEGTTNVFPKNLEETLYLFGKNGTVKLGGASCNTVDVWQFDKNAEAEGVPPNFSEETENVYGNGHVLVYKDMADALTKGTPVYINARAGRRALELVLAIYESAHAGKPVRLPFDKCSTMDFSGMFG